MTIGGEINPIMGWDIGNNLYKQDGAGISFVTSAIPVPAVKGHRGDYYINPINGFLDLQVVGFANTPNQITGYVKAGTNGINSQLVLQRAYVSWRRFTAGMKLTLFQDAYACQPRQSTPKAPRCVSTVAYEIGYTSKSYGGFRFAIAADMPSYYSLERLLSRQRLSHVRRQAGAQRRRRRDGARLPAWIEYSHCSGTACASRAYSDTMPTATSWPESGAASWAGRHALEGNLQPLDKITSTIRRPTAGA